MLDEAPTARFENLDAFDQVERLRVSARTDGARVPPSMLSGTVFDLHEGTLVAGRYRVLHRMNVGWVAYDERLTRPVIIETISGPGSPSERIRREAAIDDRLSDAIVVGAHAFAIRTTTVL